MTKIVILVHHTDRDFGIGAPGYLLEFLLPEWRVNGLEVRVIRGIDEFVPGDVLFPHTDLTKVPPDFLAFMQRYPVVVNRHVADTSKSAISHNLVRRGDPYPGPVIVKTVRNYGGLPEASLAADNSARSPGLRKSIRDVLSKGIRKATGSQPWRYITHLNPQEYPVFPSLREVPDGVFQNDALVVEKYLPERDGDDYLLRYYYFLGDRERCLLLRSKHRVVKFSNAHQVEEIPVHPELHELREQLGFDFGKFDYFVHDGKVMLFDVNKTPGHTAGHAGGRHEPLYQAMVKHLAGGIESILDGRVVSGVPGSACAGD